MSNKRTAIQQGGKPPTAAPSYVNSSDLASYVTLTPAPALINSFSLTNNVSGMMVLKNTSTQVEPDSEIETMPLPGTFINGSIWMTDQNGNLFFRAPGSLNQVLTWTSGEVPPNWADAPAAPNLAYYLLTSSIDSTALTNAVNLNALSSGYLRLTQDGVSSGIAQITTSTTVPAADITGIVAIENGGTGTDLSGSSAGMIYYPGGGGTTLQTSLLDFGTMVSGVLRIVNGGSGQDFTAQPQGIVKYNGTTMFSGPVNLASSSEVTGVLAVANGGTGANNATTARANLGVAKSGANSDIGSLSGLAAGTITIGTGPGEWNPGPLNPTSPVISMGTGPAAITTNSVIMVQVHQGGNGVPTVYWAGPVSWVLASSSSIYLTTEGGPPNDPSPTVNWLVTACLIKY
jgi:hypothetical protein